MSADLHAIPAEWADDPSRSADALAYLASLDGANPSTNEAVPQQHENVFATRVTERRVDLVQRIEDGIPEMDYLPASHLMLVRGRRHYLPAPKKLGKSLTTLIQAVDMALAGAHVVIFDRENGGNLYASRLKAIVIARGLEDRYSDLRAGIAYYEFPQLRSSDEVELVALCRDADLVVFDSQRMYLSDLGLDENSSDDYAVFMAALIDPLFRAGVATLVLDNAGHVETKRGRGSSAKGDLNEILFSLQCIEKFDAQTTGRLRLEIEDSRFGTSGCWEMEIGGGLFGSWTHIERDPAEPGHSGFRPTVLMERASRFLEMCSEPVARGAFEDAVQSRSRDARRLAIDTLVREGYATENAGPRRARLYTSIKPYRQADDPTSHTSPDFAPTSPGEVTHDLAHLARPLERLSE